MKDYTSKLLRIVALAYMAFPLTYILVAAVLFDIPMQNLAGIPLSPFFFFLSIFAVCAGYGFWEMRHWAWYLFLVVNLLMIGENALVVHSYSESHHKVLAFIVSIGLLAALMRRVSREVRVPYFFPRIRWWESNPRYKLSVPVRVARRGASQLGMPDAASDGEILDLSMSGCFVKIRTDLKHHEIVSLVFTVFGLKIECEGAVVWLTQSRVTHPKGIGVKFALTTRTQKRSLKQINGRLRKIASLYRRSRYLMSQDEFMKRLDEIEKRDLQNSA